MQNIEPLLSSVGRKVSSIRNVKGLTRVEIESRTGLDDYVIEEIEEGKTICTLLDLYQLALALDVEVRCFFEVDVMANE